MTANTPHRPRVHLNAYIDADVRDRLELLAREHDRTLSAEIRRGLRAHVEGAHAARADPPTGNTRRSSSGVAA